MILAYNNSKNKNIFLVDSEVFPQTLKVLETRAKPLGIEIKLVDWYNLTDLEEFDNAFGLIVQLPNNKGSLRDPSAFLRIASVYKCMKIAIVDPLCQVLMQPVGDMGFDIAVGSMQRFGIPMGFGGPHAAFFAISEKYKRKIPGRIVGQSVDTQGNKALRLALQTREQHIRRDKATSNICTAQALLANMAGFYAAYHGSEGLKKIATRVLKYRQTLQKALKWCGIEVDESEGFDTVRFKSFLALEGFNVRYEDGYTLITLDECTTLEELKQLVDSQLDLTNRFDTIDHVVDTIGDYHWLGIPERKTPWLTQEVFNLYHSETNMMRYINELVQKDFSLVNGMMPLGSCTMKLNAASELMPVSWPEFANIHPFAPASQALGYDIISLTN